MADEKNDDLEKDLEQEEPEAAEDEVAEGEDAEEQPEDETEAGAPDDDASEEDAEPEPADEGEDAEESDEDAEESDEDAEESDEDEDAEESDEDSSESEEPAEDAEEEPEDKGKDKDKAGHKEKREKKESADKKKAKPRPKKQGSKSKARSKGSKRNPKGGVRTFSRTAIIVCAIVFLVVGVLLDHFALYDVLNGSAGVSDKTTVTESGLDSVMGTYIYGGTSYQITVRDVIESSSTLDNAKNDDGTYDIPAADDALSYARNEILQKAVEDEGITVSDDEVDAYAEEYLGTSDYELIAENWGISEDAAKETIKESCAVSKLRDKKVGTLDATLPDEPTAAAEGEEDVATAEYGEYIVNLLGDEWDSENETWARTDGPYYEALSGETFTSTSATYAQAEMAYYVAYSEYETAYSEQQSEWTDYVNGLLSNASIHLYTLGV